MPDDLDRLVELLLATRVATDVRRYPTIWRVRLLLASRVGDPAHDTRVWEDTAGRLVGLAMLWRRRRDDAYLVLDRFVHPACLTTDVTDASLAWGDRRAHEIAAKQDRPLTLYAGVLGPDEQLASCGFAPVNPDPQQRNVYFSRSLPAALPAPTLPAGHTIRSLQGLDELAAYHDLYGFAAVDTLHRQELLASDEYSHLVVADPAGAFVAYGECSICRAEWERSSQRIGWVDYVGTRPARQRQGLGRVVLLACLHRLRAWGADTAMLVTVSGNTSAVRLYETTGLRHVDVHEPPRYEKRIPAPDRA